MAALVLGAAWVAPAQAGALPWEGGDGVASPFEQRESAIATELSGRQATAYCNSAGQWANLGVAWGFPDDRVAAFVPGTEDEMSDFIEISPTTCYLGDRFLSNPRRDGQKRCQVGTVKRRAARRRAVPHRVPVYGLCSSYPATIDSIETLAHEPMHVAGVRNEAAAECFALQLTTVVANRLGAEVAFSYEIGKDYLPYYAAEQQENPAYWSADCHDGGPLDIWPDAEGWPTPTFLRPAIATLTELPRLPATTDATAQP
jgi:hypothetical protein